MKKLLTLFLLFIPISIKAAHQESIVSDLSKGMYSYPSANEIPDNSAAYIQNFYTDIQPLAVERNGSVVLDSNVGSLSKAIKGLWKFADNSGSEWIIEYSSRTYYKHTVGGSPQAFGFTSATDAIPRAATNLGKIMFVNGTDLPWTFDGITASTVAAPVGNNVAAWRNRFVISGISGAQSTLRFSADGDATIWTLGGNPTDPFSIQIGGANDGYPIKCLGIYLDNLIAQRKYDTWAISGFSQSDVENRNMSPEVGCIEPGTAREFDGSYLFLSARGMEEMRGNTISLISEPIRDAIDIQIKNTLAQKSNTQTTQADFSAGTAGGTLSTSVLPDSVVPATLAAKRLTDETTADFALGSYTKINIGSDYGGNLSLAFVPTAAEYACQSGNTQTTVGCPCQMTQSFQVSHGINISSITFLLSRTATSPGDIAVTLTNDSIGNTLATGVISIAGVTTNAAGSNQTLIFATPIALTANTRYRLTLKSSGCTSTLPGTCNAAQNSYFYYYLTNSPCNSTGEDLSGSTSKEANFAISGYHWESTGTFQSRIFDVGFTTQTWLWNWGTLQCTKSLVSGSSITFKVQSSADGSTFDPHIPVAEDGITTATVRRYALYDFTLTGPGNRTPTVSGITLNAGPFISTGGLFTSQLLSIGSDINSWKPVSISDTKVGGTITYQFGSANSANINSITNWQSITNGGLPTISTNPYAAFRSSFTVNVASANMALAEFVTAWNEGTQAPSPSSINYDRRYWLSLTTQTANSSSQDTIYIYQRNRTWTLFKGINAASFAIWRDLLYFGDSTISGNTYQFDIGNNDNGNPISSIIVTKSYDFGKFINPKDFNRCYVGYLGSDAFTGSWNLFYDLDRYGQLYQLGTANMNSSKGLVSSKFYFPLSNVVRGNEIQYTLTKSGVGSRLKLYGINTFYDLQEAP